MKTKKWVGDGCGGAGEGGESKHFLQLYIYLFALVDQI